MEESAGASVPEPGGLCSSPPGFSAAASMFIYCSRDCKEIAASPPSTPHASEESGRDAVKAPCSGGGWQHSTAGTRLAFTGHPCGFCEMPHLHRAVAASAASCSAFLLEFPWLQARRGELARSSCCPAWEGGSRPLPLRIPGLQKQKQKSQTLSLSLASACSHLSSYL